jgi:hypothetical protein
MELHELKVGQGGTRAPGQGYPISGSARRIGGMQPEAARTTVRKHYRTCSKGEGMPGAVNCLHTDTHTILYQQITDKRFFIQHNRGTRPQCSHERALNFRTRGIASSVEHTPATVRTLTAQQQPIRRCMTIASRLRAIKLDPHLDKPVHCSRSLFYQNTYSGFVTQTSTSSYRILKMEFRAIVRSQRHRETTLRITRVALTKLPFRQEGYAHMLRQTQCDRKSSDAATNNDDIKRLAVSHPLFSFE